jgi:hypothetical protein
MDAEEKRKQLEKDILSLIAQKLQNGQIDLNRAQMIARMLLDKLHPPLTLEQIYAIAPTLDDHFAEISAAILPIINEHNEKIKNIVVDKAEQMIKSGNLEQADKVLREALQKGESKNG